jgi:hypothetical protein
LQTAYSLKQLIHTLKKFFQIPLARIRLKDPVLLDKVSILFFVAMKIRPIYLSLFVALAYWGHVCDSFMISPSFSVCLPLSCTSGFYFKAATFAAHIERKMPDKVFRCQSTNQHCTHYVYPNINKMRRSFQTTWQSVHRQSLFDCPKHLPLLSFSKHSKVQRPVCVRSTSSVQEGTDDAQNTYGQHPAFETFARERAAASGISLKFIPVSKSPISSSPLNDDVSPLNANLGGGVNSEMEPKSAGLGTIKSLVFVCNGEPVLVMIR